ncbi:MAG: hypothetical protein WCC04_08365 [Terriglobales bacterium]
MRVLRRVFLAALFLIVFCPWSLAASGESDQAVAERVLGPQWKHLSCRAGMVFAGTVLADRVQTARTDRNVPSIAMRFRVDRAIAGVEPGQVLTIQEWTGAWSIQPPMRRGERFLLFLYPLSRLGLTSLVGGSQGQIPLDPTGRYILGHRLWASARMQNAAQPTASLARGSASAACATHTPADRAPVTLDQLERAIRSARGE